MTAAGPSGALPAAFLTPGCSSFTRFAGAAAPEVLPGPGAAPGALEPVPHGTTIVAATFASGVLLAGDRRATMGNLIASHTLQKVFLTDESSAVGIAGTAGIAIELVRLFQVELEHYEKIEGTILSLEGKAHRLAGMIRGNLAMALNGLAAVPLFVGYDERAGAGRIFSYDVTGGCYEETRHHSVGSGSIFARGALKKLWRPDLPETDAVEVVVGALHDAAEDDSATGGPDVGRRIWPMVAVLDADGARFVPEADVEQAVRRVLAQRRTAGEDPR